MKKNQNLLFLSSELPDGTEAPELVPLFLYGRTKYTKGGKLDEYEFGPADADRLVTEFVALGVDAPVDYNHQTLRAKDNGQPAPAAGWITALEKQPDGLYARVKWTARAADMIRNKEYRYTSPTFYRGEDGGVARFYNLALTNKPATIDCPELVAAEFNPPEYPGNNKGDGNLKTIGTLLGLSSDLDGEALEGAIRDRVTPMLQINNAAKELLDQLRGPLALSADADLNAVTGKVLGLVTAAAEGTAAKTRLTALETEVSSMKRTTIIDRAKAEGKLTNAQLPWAEKQTPEALEAFLAAAPVVVDLEDHSDPTKLPKPDPTQLSDTDRDVAKLLGLSDEDFLAAKKGASK